MSTPDPWQAAELKREAMKYDHLVQDIGFIHDRSQKGAGRSVDRLLALRYCATTDIERLVFVSRCSVQLPSEEQLAQWLREERAHLEQSSEVGDG